MNNIELIIPVDKHRNLNQFKKNASKTASEYRLSLSQFAVRKALYSKEELPYL